MEDLAPTHVVSQANVGRVVVLEGAGFWACVRLEQGDLDWMVVAVDRLVRQRSKGSACYGVLHDHLRFMGPMRRHTGAHPGASRQH